MNSDSYFEIGTHSICQDYVLHHNSPDICYVILSDGCSSVEHSEIGAQILCHVAKYFIDLYHRTNIFDQCATVTIHNLLGNSIRNRADEIRKLYQINSSSLEATLMIAVATQGKLYEFVFGDGIIIKKFKNEQIKIKSIDFSANAPFYLINDKIDYLNFLKNEKKINNPIRSFTDIEKDSTEAYSFDAPYYNYTSIEETELNLVMLCSDGILSYRNLEKNPVNLLDICSKIIKFPNTAGEFVKRTMIYFKKENEKKHWTHYDDVGCGAIIL